MKIIGHRGAAGSELENTLASFQAAVDMGVYAIEFDVRKTEDDQLVICHDADLSRVASDRRKIKKLKLKQVQEVPLLSGASVPTLAEALEVVGSLPVYIELKDSNCSKHLIAVLSLFPKAHVNIVSFNLNELTALRKLTHDYCLYALERTKPFDIIHMAKQLQLNGVGFNYWLLNPLTYFLCKRAGLKIFVYTVNRPFHAQFLSRLYPEIAICTDFPEPLITRTKWLTALARIGSYLTKNLRISLGSLLN